MVRVRFRVRVRVRASRLPGALSHPSSPPQADSSQQQVEAGPRLRGQAGAPLMPACSPLTPPGLHVLRVPGDLPPEDGASGPRSVPHGGDALQGQARPVPQGSPCLALCRGWCRALPPHLVLLWLLEGPLFLPPEGRLSLPQAWPSHQVEEPLASRAWPCLWVPLWG